MQSNMSKYKIIIFEWYHSYIRITEIYSYIIMTTIKIITMIL